MQHKRRISSKNPKIRFRVRLGAPAQFADLQNHDMHHLHGRSTWRNDRRRPAYTRYQAVAYYLVPKSSDAHRLNK